MVISRETQEALRIMGLTYYETQAYITLSSLISAKASDISINANIPRSKVYQVLKSLVEKGFVEMSRGKPLKFTVISPHEIFNKNKTNIIQTLDLAENELNQVYESQIPEVPAPIWLIHGPKKVTNKEMEIISRAKESIFILGGLMFSDEPEKLVFELNKAIKKGVEVKILTAPSCKIDQDEVQIKEILSKLPIDIKFFPVPYIKLVVRDNKEMLIAFCKLKGDTAISETAIAIWNQYQEFVDTVTGIYDFIYRSDLFNHAFMQ
jgi:sugar-specific transcriptional regulator TrmB